jgi:MoaA/NifB/PqqE/SkfB family radical SAM enzyme
MPDAQQANGGLPRSVMIELTNECQLACTTCPRDKIFAKDYDIGTMSFGNFGKIFSQFEENLDTLDLTGLGESLMHPDIFRIIRWVRSRRKVHIYLTTNTILLTP